MLGRQGTLLLLSGCHKVTPSGMDVCSPFICSLTKWWKWRLSFHRVCLHNFFRKNQCQHIPPTVCVFTHSGVELEYFVVNKETHCAGVCFFNLQWSFPLTKNFIGWFTLVVTSIRKETLSGKNLSLLQTEKLRHRAVNPGAVLEGLRGNPTSGTEVLVTLLLGQGWTD